MEKYEKENRELRRLLRDLVALATTPAGWVGRDRVHIAESVADIVLHTLRADAVYVCLQSPHPVEVVRSPQHHGFGDEVRRVWRESAAGLGVETITASNWPTPLRVALQRIGISADDGFIAVGCSGSQFPNEAESLLLSLAANQTAVALQTASLRTEADLERHRLRDVIAQAPAAIGLLTGPEHRWVYVNDNYVRVTGRDSASDFVGKTLRESLPEIENQPFIQILDDVYRTGKAYAGHEMKATLHRTHTGQSEEAYFNFVYQPVLNSEAITDSILVHAVEVTEQVLARQEVEKREQQFRTLAESIPQLVWMAEPDGYIVWYNQRWFEYTGAKPEEMEGWGWETVHDPDVLPKVLERWKRSIAKGEPFEMVFPLRGADGVFRDFLTRVHPIKDIRGNVTRWFGTNTDVTAQRKAELAVRESERRFREMIDALPAAIYTTDAEGRLTHFNPAAVEFCGRTPELGRDQWCVSWKLYYPDGRPMPHDRCPMAIALKEGRVIKGAEAIAELPDGTRRWFMPHPTPFRDEHGKIVGGINMLVDITARKQAEEATADLAAIVSSSDDAILSKNLDGIIRSWNKSAERLFGYTAKEAIGKHITVIVPSDRRSEEENILSRLRRGERIDHFETVRMRKDGTAFDVSLTISPIKDPSGRVIGASNVARDISHLKRIERALRDSEERFRAIVDTTPECVKLVAPDGTLLHMNSSGLGMVGALSPAQVVGQSIYDLIAHEDRERFREFNNGVCGGRNGNLSFDIVRLDGERRHMETQAAPLRNPDGTVVQLAVTRDITERKRIEQALQESEKKYREFAETASIALHWVSADGTIIWANRAELEMLGYSSEEYIGHNIAEFHADAPVLEDILTRLLHGEKIKEYEARLRAKNGSLRHVIIDSSALFKDGKFVHTRCFTRDISERKQAEELLRQSEERLRALVNASTYVVYRMSPDWSEMRQLDGRGFISDTPRPTKDWLREYIHPDDQRLVLDAIDKAIQSKSVFELEHRVRRVDGGLGWTVSRAVPILDRDGEIAEWFGAATDITARKVAEENFRKLAENLDAEVRARTRELEERNSEVLRQSEQVRELSWRLLRTQEEERRHIARELHDSAGQTLTVLGMNVAQFVQKTGRTAPEVAAEAETIQEMVQQLHRDIRTTSYLLHPPLLDESGLYSALSWYTEGLVERSGLQIGLDMPQEFGRLPGDMELVIFRLVQECLTNIHRHSGSKSASIRVAREGSHVVLEIKDKGHGMSAQRLAEIQSAGSGVGIRGMRERLRQFAGQMEIQSDKTGTRICVTIPIPKTEKHDDNITPESLHVAI